jgi:acyl transferase domain-containing protein/NADPH:quinone reductase-like Zn-dependent oxidoreductase/thioesterase domain-containing protein/acyl carrier protein
MQYRASGYDIAVIGLAGRFPGAANLEQFWVNLRNGVESVRFFNDDELLRGGESPAALRDPAYVKAQPVLDDFDRFDAALFGFSPQDAAIMDPQHRVFLEVGWEALENAGHESETFPGSIGVFATCGMNTYMMYNLVRNKRIMDNVGEWLVRHTGNDMNFLATRLSYELNLTGPSMNVQTACSSALVAVHLACQSLLAGECDMAIAGGATIVLPHARGYSYKEGEILSPDGHCRPFDAKARGTLFGSGAGAVVLRRHADAAASGDQILAVVKGSAVNNDGCGKVGFLAPSVSGQAKAVIEALALAEVDPETISYVETHGTGTIVGDPIEVVALTQAYRQFTSRCGYCALGSLKSNIGHLGEAAGVAAFIKTVLALQNREIPPSLHYEAPNPELDFPSSPFFVNTRLAGWQSPHGPRRAGITSLGAGGTNCHVIIEEPPEPSPSGRGRAEQLLLLSAHTPLALETATHNLASHLSAHPELDLADVAYTLHVGRKALAYRCALVCRTREQAAESFQLRQGLITSDENGAGRPVAFLFPGQGAQYPGMGRQIYESERVFRDEVDRCVAILFDSCRVELRDILFASDDSRVARERLTQTSLAQPALFVIEYALAKLWMSWGVQPQAMLGHSIGEYVAACLAGVFSLDDALALVADRGRLMQQAPQGAMLAVPIPAAEIEPFLSSGLPGARLSLAASNAPSSSVIAGPEADVTRCEETLAARGIHGQRLETSHAFHSELMDPILTSFGERVRRIALHAPGIPYLSNRSGTWIQKEEATDPEYWVRHLRSTVRFSDCLASLLRSDRHILLEVGPGRTLTGLARQQPTKPDALLQSLGRSGESAGDLALILNSCGRLWSLGRRLDASGMYAGQRRRRVPLPTYPFERKRYWIDPDAVDRDPAASAAPEEPAADVLHKKSDIAEWFYAPVWRRASFPVSSAAASLTARPADWLVFLDESGVGAELVERLRRPAAAEAAPEPVRLEIGAPGEIDCLEILPAERQLPGPGEVEIRVRAAALNFADALKATGVFPEAPFGMECSGVIERVGPDVAGFRAGDAVLSIGPNSFRSYVVRDARLVARKPEFLSFEEATTLPAAFMTAWYALHHVGKLRPRERVLIHAASGGVGLAAIQVARLAGAEIFATAGNSEKRAFLKSLGVRHVFDSRSLEFADAVTKRTHRKGVHLVLNSLTGEFIPASLALLAEGGRFLEIGKREIYSSSQLAELPLRAGVSYHPIDLTRLHRDDLSTYGALFHEIVAGAAQRRFEPLSRQVFPFSAAFKAFGLMMQARHIGKLVLSMRPEAAQVYTVRAGAGFRRLSDREFVLSPGREADYRSLLQELEDRRASIGRIVHLWNVSPGERESDLLASGLDRAFFSLNYLAKAVGTVGWDHAVDLAVISTGLQQIAGETAIMPQKAILLGPCRVIPREFPNIVCRSIDIAAARPGSPHREQVIRQLLCELTAEASQRFIALRNTGRWVQTIETTPVRPAAQTAAFREGGVYLITGGLGGLGLACATYLARRFRAKLVLVSRTSLPPRSQWQEWLDSHEEADSTGQQIRGIQECEQAGAAVLIATADVTDAKRMRATIGEARRRFGSIHGVIHAAGTLDDGLIQLKTPDSVRKVLAPKVLGTMVLDEVLGSEPSDFFVLFSSVSSILGIEGQVDYTAANAFLDAFASARYPRSSGRTVAINWSAWKQIGMAAGRSKGQRVRPSGTGTVPRSGHPWLERRHQRGEAVEFVTEFSHKNHWLLNEHAIRGGPALIPGTGFLELARAAMVDVEQREPFELSRVFFQAPFVVPTGQTRGMVLTLQPAGTSWDFRIQSQSDGLTHVTGQIATTFFQRPKRVDMSAVAARCNLRTQVLDGFLTQSFMDFGGRWANVRHIHFGRNEALVTLELRPEFCGDTECHALHPALLDMATGGAQALIPGFDPERDFYVPISYGRLVIWEGLTPRLESLVKLQAGSSGEIAVFDVTITDQSGSVLVEISDFTMKKIAKDALSAAPAAGALASPSSRLAEAALMHGIEPEEGVAVLERILSSDVAPQVIVSSTDLHIWMKLADAALDPAAGSARRDTRASGSRCGKRSEGSSAAFSGDPVAARLAALFSELLGVDTVGPRDDFFELGGHSLLAVRLLARIEREFKKVIPLPELFQSPTIEHLATFLRGDLSDKGEAGVEAGPIVPLNDRGTGPAFYCVHSVGGEVMSFRHLSRLLGPEQRFYGIQAPPSLRNAAFAASIESMARYYVSALLDFQPEGPYLLGGWSAGSVIALEMAQQIRATGRTVDLLVALDGAPRNGTYGTSAWNPLVYWKLLRNFPGWITEDLLLEASFGSFARRVRNKLVSFGNIAAATVRREPNRHGYEVEGFLETSHFSEGQVRFMRALFDSLHAYKASPYPGSVLLFKARTEPLYHLLEVEKRWSQFASDLQVVEVRGTHSSIVWETRVGAVAAVLKPVLGNWSAVVGSAAVPEEALA